MWPFKKKPVEGISAVPEEIQDYYAAERRGRSSVAWLLALITLLTTLALAALLFFGGRWVYRKIHHNKPGTTTQTTPPQNTDQQPVANPGSAQPPTSGKSSTKKTTKKPAKKPVANPQATNAGKNLVNTGPGNILGIFVVTTLVATTGHLIVKSRSS